jgi:hypothetical protein
MENELYFRQTPYGYVTVNELNTKITYTVTREYRVGRLMVTHTHVNLHKTAAARVRYFYHNNRLARFRRALVPAVKQKLNALGFSIYVAQ